MTRPLRGLGTNLKQDVDQDGAPRGTHSHFGNDDSPWWINTWDGNNPRTGGPSHCRISLYIPPGIRRQISWHATGKDQRRALANCCRKVRESMGSYELRKAVLMSVGEL